ncbi:hypothetical protein Sjap_022244 [Stephania japonica]|uniref:Uncharacterized protein n=1 Tax=Stephania japonica TaxID=461633 RepID=A0AAP0HTI9_9MAGN
MNLSSSSNWVLKRVFMELGFCWKIEKNEYMHVMIYNLLMDICFRHFGEIICSPTSRGCGQQRPRWWSWASEMPEFLARIMGFDIVSTLGKVPSALLDLGNTTLFM